MTFFQKICCNLSNNKMLQFLEHFEGLNIADNWSDPKKKICNSYFCLQKSRKNNGVNVFMKSDLIIQKFGFHIKKQLSVKTAKFGKISEIFRSVNRLIVNS